MLWLAPSVLWAAVTAHQQQHLLPQVAQQQLLLRLAAGWDLQLLPPFAQVASCCLLLRHQVI
jgi:hypothetical protein